MNLPKRKPNRIKNYDYSSPGAYFITVCTHEKRCIFGQISVGATIGRPPCLQLSAAGKIVDEAINNIEKHYPTVSVDHYVIMPNHVHLLLQIHADESGRAMLAPTGAEQSGQAMLAPTGAEQSGRAMLAPTGTEQSGRAMLAPTGTEQSGRPMVAPTISTVIQQMKGYASKKAGQVLWQKLFHDHVIRDEQDYLRIWNYIDTNPGKWTEDCFYVPTEA